MEFMAEIISERRLLHDMRMRSFSGRSSGHAAGHGDGMSNGYISHQANGSIDDRDLGSQVGISQGSRHFERPLWCPVLSISSINGHGFTIGFSGKPSQRCMRCRIMFL